MVKRSGKKSRGRPRKSQTKRRSACNKKKMSPCKKSKSCNWVRGKSKGSRRRKGYCRKSPKRRSKSRQSKKRSKRRQSKGKSSFSRLTGFSPRIVKTPSPISPIYPTTSASSSNTSGYSLGNIGNIGNIYNDKNVVGIPLHSNKDVVGINVGNNNTPIALKHAVNRFPIQGNLANQVTGEPLFDSPKKVKKGKKKSSISSLSSSSSSSSSLGIDEMEHALSNSRTSFILDNNRHPNQIVPRLPLQNIKPNLYFDDLPFPQGLNLPGLNSPE